MDNSKSSSNSFVTFILVVILILFRIFSELTDFSVSIVAGINILMLSYIFYNIDKKVNSVLKKRVEKNKIFCRQFYEYRFRRKVFIILFIIVSVIFILFTYFFCKPIICGVLNDSIAFIAFGLSVEEDVFTNIILDYFKYRDFGYEREKKLR